MILDLVFKHYLNYTVTDKANKQIIYFIYYFCSDKLDKKFKKLNVALLYFVLKARKNNLGRRIWINKISVNIIMIC